MEGDILDDVKMKLLERLRVHVHSLLKKYDETRFKPVTDGKLTEAICSTLEAIFLHQIKSRIFLSKRQELDELCFCSYLKSIVSKDLLSLLGSTGAKRTNIGRCRVWIRHSLNEGTLAHYLSINLKNSKKMQFYYADAALNNDFFVNRVIATLELMEELRFKLDLSLAYLNSWTHSEALHLLGLCPKSSIIDRQFESLENLFTMVNETQPMQQEISCNDEALHPPLEVTGSIVLPTEDLQSSQQPAQDQTSSASNAISSHRASRTATFYVDNESSSAEKIKDRVSSKSRSRSRSGPRQKEAHQRSKMLNNYSSFIPHNATDLPVCSNNLINQSRACWVFPYKSTVIVHHSGKSNSSEDKNVSLNNEFNISDNSWQVVGEDLLVTPTDEDVARLVKQFPGVSSFDYKDGQNCVFHGHCSRCNRFLKPGSSFLDHYDAQFYCVNCHQLQECVIPRNIVFSWDFSLRSVCQTTRLFLTAVHNKPVINLADMNPTLYAIVPALFRVRQLRRTLIHLWHQISRCNVKVAYELKHSLSSRDYMMFSLKDLDLYSIADLCAVQSGQLELDLRRVISSVALVHVHGCSACHKRALICDLCQDLRRPIWPHEFSTYWRCSVSCCGKVFHISCIPNPQKHEPEATVGCFKPIVVKALPSITDWTVEKRCRTCAQLDSSIYTASGHYADPFVISNEHQKPVFVL